MGARDSAFVAAKDGAAITSEMMFGGGAGMGAQDVDTAAVGGSVAMTSAAMGGSPASPSASTNIVFGDVQACAQCGNTAKGKTDENDGQFYCAECWKAFAV